MRIIFNGKPINKKLKKKYLREAIKFYCDSLMTKKSLRGLSLTFDFSNNTKELDGNKAVTYPVCEPISDPRPKSFLIYVDRKLGIKPTLKAIAHECVHVEQFRTGRLYDYVNHAGQAKWDEKLIDKNKLDYWDHPWEIEAYGKELGLYWRFIEHYEFKK